MLELQIYTVGYSKITFEEMKTIATVTDGCIVDVRERPESMNPRFCKKYLQQKLGDRYYWARGFGNKGRHRGIVSLTDPNSEMGIINYIIRKQNRSPIFMCMEEKVEECHRLTVANLVRSNFPDLEIEHLVTTRAKAIAQGYRQDLFGNEY